MDRAAAQEIWGLFSALPSSCRSIAWPVCLPAHRESPAASCPPALLLSWRLLSALGEQLWAPPQPQGFHSSSTACRAGGIWELLVTRTATDVLTLPFSVWDSPLLLIPIFCQFWHICEHVFVYKQYYFICCSLITVVSLRTSPTIVSSQLLP